jgi:hypothetical protein
MVNLFQSENGKVTEIKPLEETERVSTPKRKSRNGRSYSQRSQRDLNSQTEVKPKNQNQLVVKPLVEEGTKDDQGQFTRGLNTIEKETL